VRCFRTTTYCSDLVFWNVGGKTEIHSHCRILFIHIVIVAAIFAGETASSGLKQVQLRVDTGVLLKSMVDQARIVVLKAVATATNTSVKELPTATASAKREEENEKALAATTEALGSFRSALKLSRTEADPRLQKARTSALRLNRALHGKRTNNLPPGPTLGMRKSRSVAVKWDHPGTLHTTPRLNATLAPQPKKPNYNDTASKLKSFKSFGRPHAGDFGSGPRNATFGEYGGSTTGVWGRGGRLAEHPTPMMEAPVDHMGNLRGGGMDLNATFGDIVSASRSSSAAAGAALLMGRTSSSTRINLSGSAAQLPRSATALENTFMKKFSS